VPSTTNEHAPQEETAMANHAILDTLHERLQQTADVEIEFAPESLGGGEVRHMMSYVPGGIRVEFLSPSA
jgi:hypothetical protein